MKTAILFILFQASHPYSAMMKHDVLYLNVSDMFACEATRESLKKRDDIEFSRCFSVPATRKGL